MDTASVMTEVLQSWSRLWDEPRLPGHVAISFSRRLRVTLGRCTPATGRIVLRADLAAGPRALLLEVLCHEAAHVATHLRHGRAARPHGPEWADLVSAAGYTPTTCRSLDGTEALADRRTRRGADAPSRSSRFAFLHECPVCHTRRYARRAVPSWRCAECLQVGLGGELVVTRTTGFA